MDRPTWTYFHQSWNPCCSKYFCFYAVGLGQFQTLIFSIHVKLYFSCKSGLEAGLSQLSLDMPDLFDAHDMWYVHTVKLGNKELFGHHKIVP